MEKNKALKYPKKTRKAICRLVDATESKKYKKEYAELSMESRAMTRLLFLTKGPQAMPAEKVAGQRRIITTMAYLFGGKFKDVTVKEGVLGGREGEFYRRKKDKDYDKEKFFLYIHGGGYCTGSVASRRFIAEAITRVTHCNAFSMSSHQWPEGHFPQGLSDVVDVYRAILEKGYKPENIIVGGESGGAILTIQLCKFCLDHGLPAPGKILLLCPVMDCCDRNNPYMKERKKLDALDPMLYAEVGIDYYFSEDDFESPYNRLWKNDFKGFPETFLTYGTHEVLSVDAKDLDKRLTKARVPHTTRAFPKMYHAFMLFDSPETDVLLDAIDSFLND